MDGMMDKSEPQNDAEELSSSDKAKMLKDGVAAFERCHDSESENRRESSEDIRFSKLGEQWPDAVKREREADQRPCLTINRMPTFIRQVVNDARQNKPAIRVKPFDSQGDTKTAEVINGLIRNIEHVSNADVAYDTAIDCSASGGVGYFRIGLDYAFDDSFEMDIAIERVMNPMTVYGDPDSTSADGSDWDVAFVVDRISKADFKAKYKGKANTDFQADSWADIDEKWCNDSGVLVAEWWKREEVDREIVRLSDGRVFGVDQLEEDEDLQGLLASGVVTIEAQRTTKTHKVTQTKMSGVDILEHVEWPGKFIPIVPVYGEEFCVDGKRYFRSLINQAKDAQRMFNYWRSASTEMIALAPRVPFIGEEGAFDSDAERWATANTRSHAYLEYGKGKPPPQRQPLGMENAAGAVQEAMNASDDMKSIMGLYDASLGARSNETSGKAIMARQREGDVSTFHFIDNLARAIRHGGRIIVDLIPHVYSGPRVVRVLGEDGSEQTVPVNQEYEMPGQQQGASQSQRQPVQSDTEEAVLAMHDLTAGKYDLAVDSGPSFTTRREEAATQITEIIRAFPAAAPVLGGMLARNMDWPEADKIAELLDQMNPANQQQQIPPQVQQAIQEGQARLAELEKENAALKADKSIDQFEAETDRFEAETGRMSAVADIAQPQQIPMRQG